MPETNPHVLPLDDAIRQLQKSNTDLMGLSKSLVRVIDRKLAGLDTRVGTLEKTVTAITERDKGKFDWSIYFRDRVLPQIVTLITLSILYLTFGNPK